MPSAKGKLVRLFGGLLLSHARVVEAEEVGPGFRRIVLQGDVGRTQPGDKLQVLLPSDDVRTYSPLQHQEGQLVLLGWKNAGGPGAQWVSRVDIGADVAFARPQRSLVLPPGPVIFVGDETSVAAAASYELSRPGQVHALFQASSPDALRGAAGSLGLRPKYVSPVGETAGLVEQVLGLTAQVDSAVVALTGGSELVIAVRDALRQRGVRDIKTKTYWIPGKAGLD